MSSPAPPQVFIGRREEIDALHGRIEVLREGRAGGLLLISGEAGVGKSRLVDILSEIATDLGVETVVGRCLKFGESVRPAAAALDVLAALGDHGGSDPDPGGTEHAPRLAEALYATITERSGGCPLVVVFEDLHWADATTRDLLGFLGTSLREEPVLLVGTYRSDDLHRLHPLIGCLAELQRSVRPQRMDLEPFDLQTVAELVDLFDSGADRRQVEALHRRSGGNAFYLEELLFAPTTTTLPNTLRDVVLSRSQTLDSDALTLLRVAATLGPTVDETLLARASQLDRPATRAALHQLVDCRFLAQDEYGIRFRHDLTREVFAAELLPGERSELHRRIAEELSASHPDRLGEIAHHWYESGNEAEALHSSIAAGQQAAHDGTHAEALFHYERALELWERVDPADLPNEPDLADLLLRAAATSEEAKNLRRCIELAQRGCDLLDARNDPLRLADSLVKLSKWQALAGDNATTDSLSAAMRLVESAPPSAVVGRVLAAAAGEAMMSFEPSEGIERGEAAIAIAAAAGDVQTRLHAMNTVAICRFYLGDLEGLEQLRESCDLAIAEGDHYNAIRGYINLTWSLFLAGRHEEAFEVSRAGLRYAEHHRYWSACGSMLGENASHCLEVLGRWDELDELSEFVQKCRPLDLDEPGSTDMQVFARVMVKRGETDRARPILEHDLEILVNGHHCGLPYVLAGILELDLIENRPVPRRAVIESAVDLIPNDGHHAFVETMAVAVRAEADLALRSRRRGDHALAEEAAGWADRWISHTERVLASRIDTPVDPDLDVLLEQCRVERDRAHGVDQPSSWASLVSGWEQFVRPWPTAYAKLRHAEALLLAGAPSTGARATAREELVEAHALASQLGAKPLLADIEDLATRARLEVVDDDGGVSPDRPVPFDLTPREIEVLRLVAGGQSNGQIGTELFISTKTASVHVSNILRKLEASNRVEAAAIATENGLA